MQQMNKQTGRHDKQTNRRAHTSQETAATKQRTEDQIDNAPTRKQTPKRDVREDGARLANKHQPRTTCEEVMNAKAGHAGQRGEATNQSDKQPNKHANEELATNIEDTIEKRAGAKKDETLSHAATKKTTKQRNGLASESSKPQAQTRSAKQHGHSMQTFKADEKLPAQETTKRKSTRQPACRCRSNLERNQAQSNTHTYMRGNTQRTKEQASVDAARPKLQSRSAKCTYKQNKRNQT